MVTQEMLRSWRPARLSTAFLNSFLCDYRGIKGYKQPLKTATRVLREKRDSDYAVVKGLYDFICSELRVAAGFATETGRERAEEIAAMRNYFIENVMRAA